MTSPFKSASAFLLAYSALGSAPARSQAEEEVRNKSPYFIDAIHCEGLESMSASDEQFRDKTAAIIGTKALKQKRCEEIFANFGLHRFDWHTPEDLEMIAYAIRNSNRYQSFDISIQKSQLQNHVHVFGRFVEFPAIHHFSGNASYRNDGKRGKGGPRNTLDLDASLELNRRGPANYPSGIVTAHLRESQAKDGLTMEDIARGKNKDLVLKDHDQVALAKADESFQSLAYKGFVNQSLHSRFFFDLAYRSQKLSGDETASLNERIELGYHTDSDETGLFIGATLSSWQASVLYSGYSALGSESIDKDSEQQKDIIFVGIKHETIYPTLTLDWSFYRAASHEIHYFGDIALLWTFAHWGGLEHAVDVEADVLKGAVLPEQRFSLDEQSTSRIYYALSKVLPQGGAQQSIALKIGNERVRYTGNKPSRDTQGIELSSGLFGVDYIFKSESFDMRVGLLVSTQRSR